MLESRLVSDVLWFDKIVVQNCLPQSPILLVAHVLPNWWLIIGRDWTPGHVMYDSAKPNFPG